MKKLREKFLEVSGRSEGVVDRNRDLEKGEALGRPLARGKRGRESFIDRTGRVGIDAMANATASSFSNRWIGIPRFEPTCRPAISGGTGSGLYFCCSALRLGSPSVARN
jgi:hypothetical protein